MGVLDKFKSVDYYRTLPKDLTEQTLVGAIFSILSVVFILYLLISEFISFLTVDIVHHMYIDAPKDTGNEHQMFQINMNITVPRMPCAITSVDAQDIMGSHVVDVGGRLHKFRTDSDGQIKFHKNGQMMEADTHDPQSQKGEGCNVYGNMIVKAVPGNFHISAHSHAELIGLFFSNMNLNTTHYVHDLWFGEYHDLRWVERAEFNPLKDSKKIAMMEPEDGGMPRSYEHYIKVVPSNFVRNDGSIIHSYQYISNSNHIVGRSTSLEKKKPFSTFIVSISAIVGGVFTVLGLINMFTLTGIKRFKSDIGKLG